jgi:glycerophosphoryl diester phosphodiesterase
VIPIPSPAPTVRVPELVAHRGWTARYPENTLAAIEAAIGAGARFVEIDVQFSSDGHPVLFHDRTLDRLCGVSGAVHERPLADLASLSCADRGRFGARFASERIAGLPAFVELIVRHPGVFAFVEIKRVGIERFGSSTLLDKVLRVLEPVRSRVALISFSLPFLAQARVRTDLPLGAVFDGFDERRRPEVGALAPEYVFCDVEGLPSTGRLDVGAARLAVYEVADPGLALALSTRGVDLVETFAIGEMLDAFRRLEGPGP